jgi:hypothetical protein
MEKLYITIEDVENYLGLNVAEEFADQIEDWIKAMSNYVSLVTNREWLADTTATARFFDGKGFQSLEIPDFIQITQLELGDNWGENMQVETGYITHPYNTTSKNTIILKNKNFEKGFMNVRVTAKWGYLASVPSDIKHAVTILTSGIVLAQTNQEGEIESEKIGNYSVKYVTDEQKSDYEKAKNIIESRKLIRI